MPAIIFKDQKAKLASYSVFDELGVPVHIVRNPDPHDSRALHIVNQRSYPDLIRLLDIAGIAYEIDGYGKAPPERASVVSGTHRRQ